MHFSGNILHWVTQSFPRFILMIKFTEWEKSLFEKFGQGDLQEVPPFVQPAALLNFLKNHL